MNDTILEEIRSTINQVVEANRHYFNIWKDHILFTWQWWLQLFLTIISVVFLFSFHKKQGIARISISGLFVLLIASWLDFIGNSYGLWYYPIKLIPAIPPYIPWDLTFTIEVLILLEYKPRFSPILKAIIMSLFNAFMLEPMTIWLGLYVPVNWNTIYSVPIYFAIYLIAHRISRSQTFAHLEHSQSLVNNTAVPNEVLSELILRSQEWSNAKRGRQLIEYISIFFQEVLQIDTGFFLYQGKFTRHVPLQVYSPWGAFAEETESIRMLVNGITLETIASFPYVERWIHRDELSYEAFVCKKHGIQEVSFWRLYFRNQCVGSIVLGRKQQQDKHDEKCMQIYMTQISLILEMYGELRIEKEKKIDIRQGG